MDKLDAGLKAYGKQKEGGRTTDSPVATGEDGSGFGSGFGLPVKDKFQDAPDDHGHKKSGEECADAPDFIPGDSCLDDCFLHFIGFWIG